MSHAGIMCHYCKERNVPRFFWLEKSVFSLRSHAVVKSRDNSWAQVDIVDSRIELAEVDEIKQEANNVPLLDKLIRIKVLW